ncbi:MAG TPA: 8-amino-7-oxononanoate synthase [Miltoncostaeaceae bacterium]|nr:8-amino-7-oxononanoate synthase [Miltoncostaeaceae bacterium]
MSRTGLDWLPEALADLEDRDLLRVLTYCQGAPAPEVAIDGVPHLLLASNNYLGLAGDPAVVAGARAALEAYGAGAGASRLVTGSLDLHRRLEERLAALKRCEDALVFPSGFQANVGTIPALVGRGDVVFSDELNHASLIDGCRLSGARVVRYAHADGAALDGAVRAAGDAPRRLIVTDTVFSMDGDLAPLPEIVGVAERHGCMLMVDEAHATGVLGPSGAGALEHFGLEGRVPVVMGTLSKALGAQGGYVAGDRDLCDYLRTRDRGFVFTTALAPAAAGAALAALDVVRDQPERRARLHRLVARLVAGARDLGYEVLPTDSAVVGVLIGEAADALAVGASLRQARVWAPAIRPPSVPPGTARLRLTVMATHEDRHIDWALEALADARNHLPGRPVVDNARNDSARRGIVDDARNQVGAGG